MRLNKDLKRYFDDATILDKNNNVMLKKSILSNFKSRAETSKHNQSNCNTKFTETKKKKTFDLNKKKFLKNFIDDNLFQNSIHEFNETFTKKNDLHLSEI